jgi:hypothetical protein
MSIIELLKGLYAHGVIDRAVARTVGPLHAEVRVSADRIKHVQQAVYDSVPVCVRVDVMALGYEAAYTTGIHAYEGHCHMHLSTPELGQ